MGKRKIGKKTRLNRQRQKDVDEDPFVLKQPHSIIISRGKVGKSTQQLIDNFRRVMDPYTARNVKVQRTNKLKDFISIAPTFNVSHVLAFSKTETTDHLNLRVIRVPRGPTLWFNVREYTLMKDVQTSLKRPISDQNLNLESALCVMNNFEKSKKHSKLLQTFIKSMFPTTNIPTLKLDSVRRVVIWNWNVDDESLDFRHYVISVAPSGCSKKIKQLLQVSSSSTRQMPNIGDVEDIAQFIKDEAEDEPTVKEEEENDETEKSQKNNENNSDGDDDDNNDQPDAKKPKVRVKIETDDEYKSGAELSENEETANVSLAQDMRQARGGNIANEKSKVVLTEFGPRMTLKLVKIQEGVNDGEVIYHDHIEKTEEQVMELQKTKNQKKDLKSQRRAQQEANIKKKQALKEEHKQKSLEGMRRKRQESQEGKEGGDEGASDDKEDDSEASGSEPEPESSED